MNEALPLPIVHVADLSPAHRALLLPDGDDSQAARRNPRPRHFYAVDSRETARRLELAPHFGLWEFLDVDVREAELLRAWPRYVPCAVALLAVHLELFRLEVGAPVRIAANGGYRSPALDGGDPESPHTWGTAANIYRIGDDSMSDRDTVERYAAIARRVLPGAWCRPYGPDRGQTIDHLHIDLGFLVATPRD